MLLRVVVRWRGLVLFNFWRREIGRKDTAIGVPLQRQTCMNYDAGIEKHIVNLLSPHDVPPTC